MITINGRPVNDSSIKLKTHKDYEVQIAHGDYYSSSETISLSVNESYTLQKSLKPRPGKINIYSNPSKADVYINDQKVGRTPLKNFSLSPGEHTVLIKRSKYKSQKRYVQIKANQRHKPQIFNLKFADTNWRKMASLKMPSFNCNSAELKSIGSYIPISFHGSSPKFNLIPFGFDSFICNRFSLGIDFIYHLDEDEEEPKDDSYSYYSHTPTIYIYIYDLHISWKSRFYLYQSNNYQDGIGPEINTLVRKVESTDNNYNETILEKTEKDYLGWGATFSKLPAPNKPLGYKLDFRQMDFNDGSSYRFSTSLIWNF